MKNIHYLLICLFTWGLFSTQFSCKHEPFMPMDDDMMPIDTTDMPIDTTDTPVDTTDMPIDTTDMPIDTTDMPDTTGIPCEPGVIYFELDVLPILISNCAFNGCHSAASAQDGVILDNYDNVFITGEIEPFDLDDSELYEAITETDWDDIMPPAPNIPLTQSQILTIGTWILQGAENLTCDPDAEGCDTDDVSFSATVQPILQDFCVGCHGGNSPSAGIDLSNHAGVETVAQNGQLYGAIEWLSGFSQMPQGGNKLPDCEIDQIKSWIDAGALNN